jgi:DNA-binding response OmpR family regulator
MSNHIFVVDDDPAMGRLTTLALKSEGYEVAAFTSPREALEEVVDPGAPNPSMVILDLSMPEMDGREFYRRARAAGLVAPVLILSAYGAADARKELGAEASLAKPFDTQQLVDAVKGLRPDR